MASSSRTVSVLLTTMLLAATAAPSTAQDTTVLVAYHSVTGNTEQMAEAVAEGVRGVAGVTVELKRMEDVTDADLASAQGLVVGAPTHWANLPPEVTVFVNRLPFLGETVAGAFATAGNPGGGSEHVLTSLIAGLLNHGALIVGPVFEEESGFRYGWMGAAALTGPVDPGVSDVELDGARSLGERVAREVLVRHGREGR